MDVDLLVVTSMQADTRYAMATVSYMGNIFAIGGEGKDCMKLNTMERFDEASAWLHMEKELVTVDPFGTVRNRSMSHHFFVY